MFLFVRQIIYYIYAQNTTRKWNFWKETIYPAIFKLSHTQQILHQTSTAAPGWSNSILLENSKTQIDRGSADDNTIRSLIFYSQDSMKRLNYQQSNIRSLYFRQHFRKWSYGIQHSAQTFEQRRFAMIQERIDLFRASVYREWTSECHHRKFVGNLRGFLFLHSALKVSVSNGSFKEKLSSLIILKT